jgi:hypothetical protein
MNINMQSTWQILLKPSVLIPQQVVLDLREWQHLKHSCVEKPALLATTMLKNVK